MSLATRNLKDDVTYWTVTGANGYGGYNFATPALVKGRWEERAEQFRDPDNEEHVSQSVVYLTLELQVGDYICKGDQTATADPTSLSGARPIMQKSSVTDLRRLNSVHKVML